MNIKIENIGKISKADINIDGITVIAGENNTGKSTVGKVLFATFDSFFNYNDYIESQKYKYIEQILRPESRNLSKILSDFSKEKKRVLRYSVVGIPRYIREYVNASSKKNIRAITREYCYFQMKPYKLDVNKTINEPSVIEWINRITEEISKMLFTENSSVGNRKITHTFSGVFNEQIIRVDNNSDDIVDKAEVHLTIKNNVNSIYFLREKEDICVANEQMLEIVHRPIFIENSRVVNNLSNPLSNSIDERDWVKSLCKPNGLSFELSLPKKDTVDDLVRSNNEINDYVILQLEDKLKEIEKKLHSIIKGRFVKTDNELQFKADGYSRPFKLSNLSTGLKAFALFQRIIEVGVLREKDVLILDEPEINLHPEWQLIYAELIIIMQQQLDLTVLLTTHSPYFLNAIEVYTKKYGIDNKCRYYLADEVDGNVEFNDVTGNTEPIYKKLFTPLQKLEDIEYNGEVVE